MAASRRDIAAGRAYVELYTRNSRFLRGLRQAEGGLRQFSNKVADLGKQIAGLGVLTFGLGVALAGAFAAPIKAATDLRETVNKFDAVFGDSADDAREWADEWRDAIGRARGETLDSLSAFQGFFTGLGVGSSEASDLSKQMHALGVDFASFQNLSDQEGMKRFISALSGSGEVLDKFGINTKQAALNAKLLEMGLPKISEGATELQKVMARMEIIIESMGRQGAIGDALRTSGELSGQMKQLRSAVKDLNSEVGQALLPTVTDLVKQATPIIKAFAIWVVNNKELIVTAAKVAVGIAAIGPVLAIAGGALFIFSRSMGLVSGLMGGLRRMLNMVVGSYLQFGAALRMATVGFGQFATGVVTSAGRMVVSATQAGVRIGASFARTFARIGPLAVATGNQVGIAISRGSAVAIGAVSRIPGVVASSLGTARQSAAAFVRGWAGEYGLFTTRFNRVMFMAGEAAQRVFGGVVDPVIRAVARKASGVWTAATDRMRAVTQAAGGRIGAVASGVAAMWAPVGRVMAGAFQRVGPVARRSAAIVTASWQRVGPVVGRSLVSSMASAFARVRAMGVRTGAAIANSMRTATAGIGGRAAGGLAGLGRGAGGGVAAIGGLGAAIGMLGTEASTKLAMTLTMIPLVITAVSGLAAAFAALLSPMGLVVAALAVGAVAWSRYTDSGKQAVKGLQDALAPFVETFKSTFEGIKDALTAGDLALAGKIAVKGLQIAFLQGMELLRDSIGGIWGDTVSGIGNKIVSGDFAGAWQDAVKGMAAIWAAFSEGVVKTFTAAASAVVDAWQNAVNAIGNFILRKSAEGGVMGAAASKLLGVDMSQEQARAELAEKKRVEVVKREIQTAIPIAEEELQKATAAGDEGEIAKRTKQIEELKRQLETIGTGPPVDLLGDAESDVARQTDMMRQRFDELSKEMNETAAAATEDAFEDLAASTAAAGSSEVERLQRELEELKKQASAAAEKAKGSSGEGGTDEKKKKKDLKSPGAAALRNAAIGSFSATILARTFGASSKDQMIADQRRLQAEQKKLQAQQLAAQKEATNVLIQVAAQLAAILVFS